MNYFVILFIYIEKQTVFFIVQRIYVGTEIFFTSIKNYVE